MNLLLLSGPTDDNFKSGLIGKKLHRHSVTRILLITFHRENKTLRDFVDKAKTLDRTLSNYEFETISDIEELPCALENFENYLNKFECIFIPGGLNEPLIKFNKLYNFGNLLLRWLEAGKNRIYIGASAGSQIVCRYVFNSTVGDKIGNKILDGGFNILEDYFIVPHYHEWHRELSLNSALKDPDLNIITGIGLSEGSAIFINIEEDPKILERQGDVDIVN